jgi:Rad9
MQATLDAYSLKGKVTVTGKGNKHSKKSCYLVFAKALTCLSKYGDELSIYATSDFLSFSATNSSKSAYCRFKYDRPFFSRYRLGLSQTRNVDLSDNVHEVQNVTGQLMTKVTPEVAFLQTFKVYAVSRP